MQRLLSRLIVRLYDKAEASAESIEDMEGLAAVLQKSGALPPALLAALEAALAADDLDGAYQVQFGRQHGVCSSTAMYGVV